MTTSATLPAPTAEPATMGVFERYLSVWVFLCIVAGIALGQLFPGPFQAIGRLELAKVNLPVGVLIEVPVMLLVVRVVNSSRGWYQSGLRNTP